MRSAGGTKSEEPVFVTLATKSTMDFFDLPSFQDGSGSLDCAPAGMTASAQKTAAAMVTCVPFIFTS
jgi:hypothetical protein